MAYSRTTLTTIRRPNRFSPRRGWEAIALGVSMLMTRARGTPQWCLCWALLLLGGVVAVACSHQTATRGEGAEDPFLPQVYIDPRFGFSVHYPEALHVTRPPPGEHRAVLVFTGAAGEAPDGFQITIDAFGERGPLLPELLQRVQPGKVMRNLQSLPVDTFTALALESEDPVIGPTYEVWWIRGGALYQVATALANADLLRRVLQTWRFRAGPRQSTRRRPGR
jgi:hypothetical protein